MTLLHRKILSIAEQKMGNLRGLRGLKVRELRKFGKPNVFASRHDASFTNVADSQIAVFEKSLDFCQLNKSMLTASGKNRLIISEDVSLTTKNNFWTTYCKPIPGNGKVGDYIDENEILVLDIDSVDIWLSVNLVMSQGTNSIHADMDIKVEKSTYLKEFNRVMQKLSLKVWNECC